MVRNITFILVVICFFGSHLIFEKLLKKKKPSYGLKRVIGISLLVEALLLTLAVYVPMGFEIMIYGTVIMACFINVFYKYRPNIVGEV